MRTVRPPLAAIGTAAALLAAACGTADEPATPVAPPTPTATVQVTPTTASVEVGDTVRFTATVTDANGQAVANPAVTWSTSQAGQAWASEDGLVTGAGPGTPTITATSQGATGAASLPARSGLGSRR